MSASSKAQVFDTDDQLIQATARLILTVAEDAIKTRGRFNFVLSGGSTPAPLYKRLSQPPYAEAMPWNETHFYWGDERIVPPTHEESNFGEARRLLLDRIQAHPDNVHRIKGELSPIDAAADYSERLSTLSGMSGQGTLFDLVLLGLGSDGHTASLFPGSIQAEERRSMTLAVVAVYGGRPAHRVTLTPLAFNRSRVVVFLVSGSEKAKAVKESIYGEIDPRSWPAHRIHPDSGEIIWMLDAEAGALLQTA